MKQYFYARDDERFGPFTLEELKAKVEAALGEVRPYLQADGVASPLVDWLPKVPGGEATEGANDFGRVGYGARHHVAGALVVDVALRLLGNCHQAVPDELMGHGPRAVLHAKTGKSR